MIVASVPLYNIFSVLVLTVTAPDAQQADHRGLVGKTLRGIITNPIILGIFAGLPFSLLAIDFPPMLDKGLSMLGNCATPMALLSIGAGFEGAKAIKKLGPTCAAVFIKLVLLSAIFLPMGVALGFREQTLVAIVILCGLRLCYGEKYGRRSCFVIVDHCAQHGAECGYADIDAVHSAFDGAYLT